MGLPGLESIGATKEIEKIITRSLCHSITSLFSDVFRVGDNIIIWGTVFTTDQ